MNLLRSILIVGLGGAIGSMLRACVYAAFKGYPLPYATFAVNIAGSFIIGIIFALALRETGFHQDWKLFLATGVCGGFTTFSALSVENVELLREGRWVTALLYITLSFALGIAAAFAGFRLFHK